MRHVRDTSGSFGPLTSLLVFGAAVAVSIGGAALPARWAAGARLSAAVCLAIVLAMTELGRLPMAQLRRAVGLPWIAGRSRPDWKAPEAPSPDQFATEAALARLRPTALTAIGVGDFAVLLWLMMFRPF